MNYYIYSLDFNGNIFYIGKTSNLKKRLSKHISESKLGRTHKENFINKILTNNGSISINIIDIVTEEESNFYEKYWICQFKQWGFSLCNLTDGGDGGGNFKGRKHSVETKKLLKLYRIQKIKIDGPNIVRGELNGRSKLNSNDVIEIRNLREDGLSYRAISLKYKVSKTTIIDIVKRRKWSHL